MCSINSVKGKVRALCMCSTNSVKGKVRALCMCSTNSVKGKVRALCMCSTNSVKGKVRALCMCSTNSVKGKVRALCTGLCDVFAQNTTRAPRACSRLLHSDEMAGRRAVTVQLLSGPREAMIQVSSLYITSFSKCGVFLQSLFTYKVKIINPNKKSDVVIHQLHKFTGKFESIVMLHAKLIEEFKENVPDSFTFNVGYFEGQRHAKMALSSEEDLKAMYLKYQSGDITLWCDGKSDDVASRIRKRDEPSSRYQERDEEVNDIFKQLKEKHSNTYDNLKLRLWARMVVSKSHESLDEPPTGPPFHGSTQQKESPRSSFTNALSGAAVAFAEVLKGPKEVQLNSTNTISPAVVVDLRMKHFEQLRYAKQLHEDSILTDAEFKQQKENILRAIEQL